MGTRWMSEIEFKRGRRKAAIRGVACGMLLTAFAWFSYLGLNAVTERAATSCVEDEHCWRCEEMGNTICGPVKVDSYQEGDFLWVEVYDSKGRLVLGPVRQQQP